MAVVTPESTDRVAIAREWVSRLPVPPVAALLSGSSALGTATEASDIDLMLVVEPSLARECFPGTDPEAVSMFEAGGLGIFWVRETAGGVELNAFAYAPDRLRSHCVLEEPLVAFKPGTRRLSGTGRAHLLDGTPVEMDRDVRPLGCGWLYDRPALHLGRYWGGVPRQAILGGGMPLTGEAWLAALSDASWEATVRQALSEERSLGLPAGTLSVLASNWTFRTRPDRYPEWAAAELDATERSWRRGLSGGGGRPSG